MTAPTFADLHLSAEVLRAIDALGFEEPTPIQAQTIPPLLAGRDVIAQAQTGTGKTAAYALPIVERMDIARRVVQALVLAPSRELAVQVAEAMHELGRTRGLAVLPVYGGQAYDRQLSGLRAGVHVVVGTPGRIMDHIRRGTLDLSTARTVVLDEADEMLDMGFVEDIEFILDLETPTSAIVFCRTKREVDDVAGTLQARGYTAVAVHGDVNQAQRERLLRAFRDGRAELLIATEVAARGLDIPDVTHVFNYDIPDDADAYIHRIGRTGRMGRKGDAITFVAPREMRQLRFIEKQIHRTLKQLRVPTLGDIAARRTETLRESLRAAIAGGAGSAYATLVAELVQEHDPLAVAAAALHLAGEASGGRREGAPAGELPATGRAGEHGMTRLHLDAGRRHGLRPGDVVGAFTSEADIPASAIGTIDLFDDFALVEVEQRAARKVLDRAAQLTLRRRAVHVTPARDREHGG